MGVYDLLKAFSAKGSQTTVYEVIKEYKQSNNNPLAATTQEVESL
jgi:hypothetical protein